MIPREDRNVRNFSMTKIQEIIKIYLTGIFWHLWDCFRSTFGPFPTFLVQVSLLTFLYFRNEKNLEFSKIFWHLSMSLKNESKTDLKMNIPWPKAAFNKIVCEINLIISLLWLLMTEPGHLYSNNHKISHYKLNQVLTDIVLSFNRVTMLRNLATTWLLTKTVFEPEFKTRDCFGL